MMKNRLFVLMILLLLPLSGCKSGETTGLELQEHFSQLERFSFSGILRTDYGDRVIDFGLDGDGADGALTLTLTSPDILKGLKATAERGGNAVLEYDGLVLETGPLPGTGLSPLETVPLFFSQFAGGYITYTGEETYKGADCLRVSFSHTESGGVTEISGWFSLPALTPLQAELVADGQLVARLAFERFEVLSP